MYPLHVYVPPCVCPSMCIPSSPPCVCPSVCMSLRVSIPSMSCASPLRVTPMCVSPPCVSLSVCLSPPCVCLLCVFVPRKKPLEETLLHIRIQNMAYWRADEFTKCSWFLLWCTSTIQQRKLLESSYSLLTNPSYLYKTFFFPFNDIHAKHSSLSVYLKKKNAFIRRALLHPFYSSPSIPYTHPLTSLHPQQLSPIVDQVQMCNTFIDFFPSI